METLKYPIAEIFRSIQGEGYHTGRTAVFVRFSGCNLKCSWCDTDHTPKYTADVEELFDKIKTTRKDSSDLVVLTGGEPTIHNLAPLLEKMDREWIPAALETNGVLYKRIVNYSCVMKKQYLWVTLSPKAGFIKYTSFYEANEIKIVLDDKINMAKIETRLKTMPFNPHLFIQPCSENFQPAIDYVLTHPWWRLSIQTQKILKVR